MGIPFIPATSGVEDWKAFEHQVRCCRGAACFGAAAAHFGTQSAKTLEFRIDRKRYVTEFGEHTWTGTYARWFLKGTKPSEETAGRILERSGGAVRIAYWRDLPLWDVLTHTPPPIEKLHCYLEAMPKEIRRILFRGSDEFRGRRAVHMPLERSEYLAIRNLKSLDAFICLLCLAAKGDLLDHDPSHLLPSLCAIDVFPHVIYRHPALAFRWEHLHACLSRIFLERLYSGGAVFNFPIEHVRANLLALRERRPSDLTMLSGIRQPRLP
jgi:hypothetical protein